MEIHVALSGEKFDDTLAEHVSGVGLLRGEYIFRRIKRYVPDEHARNYMKSYLRWVLQRFAGKPVWYRFVDAPSNELNMLKGHDVYIVEEFPTVGIRGMRRALKFPETFELEFSTVVEVAKEFPNLHVMFPYVSELAEAAFGVQMAAKLGFKNRLGIMVETPVAFYHADEFRGMGIDYFLVGMNDLSSLALGAGRGSGFDRHTHPAVLSWLQNLRERFRDVTLAVAGYHKADFAQVAESIGFDQLAVHYSSLPQFLGRHLSHFRELDFMVSFKKDDNRKRLRQWSTDLLERSRAEGGVEMQGAGTAILPSRSPSRSGLGSRVAG
jgi:phosphoenolpyruvate-protein kinase (PTS system EI component)